MDLLPGDAISPDHLPNSTTKKLTLGNGLAHTQPSTTTATASGRLICDVRKNAAWIVPFGRGGRYIPRPGNLVIGQITRSTAEFHYVSLSPCSQLAVLPVLSFDNATRKTRPNLYSGDLVYARVCANVNGRPMSKTLNNIDLECFTVSPTSGVKNKDLGPLNSSASSSSSAIHSSNTAKRTSTLCKVSLELAHQLWLSLKNQSSVTILTELGAVPNVSFEAAVGLNGRVWICAEKFYVVAQIVEALGLLDRAPRGENGEWMVEELQKALVKKVVKEWEAVREHRMD